MSDKLSFLANIKNMLADLIYLNGIVTTELIKITENSAGIRHGEEFLNKSSCISEHNVLNKIIMDIVKKYNNTDDYTSLEKHVLKHLENIK